MSKIVHVEASFDLNLLDHQVGDAPEVIRDEVSYGVRNHLVADTLDVNVSLVEPVEPEIELPTKPGTRIVHSHSLRSATHPGYFLTADGEWVSLYSGHTLNREAVLSGLREGRFVIGGPVR